MPQGKIYAERRIRQQFFRRLELEGCAVVQWGLPRSEPIDRHSGLRIDVKASARGSGFFNSTGARIYCRNPLRGATRASAQA